MEQCGTCWNPLQNGQCINPNCAEDGKQIDLAFGQMPVQDEIELQHGYFYTDKDGNKAWTEDFETSIGE